MFHLAGGRRGQVARAPLRQPVELLRRSSAQVRLRCLSPVSETAVRVGDIPVLLLSAGQASATAPAALARRHGAGSGRLPGGAGVPERHQIRGAGDFRHLVLRLGSAHRRDVGRKPRNQTATLRSERPIVEILRPDRRHGVERRAVPRCPLCRRGTKRRTTSRWSATAGANLIYRRIRGNAREPAGSFDGGADHRQRRYRRRATAPRSRGWK